MSGTVLVTGFEPFGIFTVNPSQLLAEALGGKVVDDKRIASVVLPTATRPLSAAFRSALETHRPELVIATGFAPLRYALSIERVSVNFYDYSGKDAEGVIRTCEPIEDGAEPARFSTLPVDAIAEAWTAAGIPGYVSNTAGTYLCNQLLYLALGMAQEYDERPRCGFVHVPCLPSQAATMEPWRTPSMSLDVMRLGIETAISAAVHALSSRV